MRLWDFVRSYDKASYMILNWSPGHEESCYWPRQGSWYRILQCPCGKGWSLYIHGDVDNTVLLLLVHVLIHTWVPFLLCAPGGLCLDLSPVRMKGQYGRLDVTFNSLASGRPRCHFKTAIFNLVLLIGIFTLSKDNALRWMPWDLTDDKSTLVQVLAWCHQAASHYLSQCWPSSMLPYGVTRPQWVNTLRPRLNGQHFADDIFKHIFFNKDCD